MINEKFAGAAGSQWQSQEPYPSIIQRVLHVNTACTQQSSTVFCVCRQQSSTVCIVTAVLFLDRAELDLRGETVEKNSWEISLEDQTHMQSVTLLRETHSH